MLRDSHLAEVLWLHCPTKRCCVRTVLPTGADIWRIATTLQVSPESFLRPVPAPSDGDGFALDHTQPPVYPALARRTVKGRLSACVFLLQFGDQASRCGIDGLRPLPCQSFPAVGAAGQITVDAASGCTCRTWSLAEIDRERVSTLLQQEADERQQYHELMRAWNATVTSANRRYSFSEVCHYLMQMYAARM
jgi:Fe-S-cluster containining protein